MQESNLLLDIPDIYITETWRDYYTNPNSENKQKLDFWIKKYDEYFD